jgi:hypothetical protein
MVDGGYLAAGYEYIIIDDCWLDHTRAAVSQSFEEKNTEIDFYAIGWFITTRYYPFSKWNSCISRLCTFLRIEIWYL